MHFHKQYIHGGEAPYTKTKDAFLYRRGMYSAGIILLGLVFTFSTSLALAEVRQYRAHVHGEAKLNIAFAGQELHIELESPAANIVGFEHKASTPEQKEAVHRAKNLLKDGQTLFVTPAKARCQVVSVQIDQDLLHEEDGEHHAVHMHHHDEHDVHQRHDDHHDHHDAEHEEHGHTHAAHSDIRALYTFTCKAPEKLNAIEVMLFDTFAGFEKLDVQLLSPTGQAAAQLTAKQHRLEL